MLVVNTHTYVPSCFADRRALSFSKTTMARETRLSSCTVGRGGQQRQQFTPVRWQWCEDLENTAQPSTVFTCVVCKHRRAPASVCVCVWLSMTLLLVGGGACSYFVYSPRSEGRSPSLRTNTGRPQKKNTMAKPCPPLPVFPHVSLQAMGDTPRNTFTKQQ